MVDWITISSNSGNSGTTVITVTAATYDELITRTTSLVVNTVNTSLSESVSISQAPRAVETVTVSPTTISAPSAGGTFTFNIISNGAWTISYPNEWLTLSASAGTGNATIVFNIPENTTVSAITGNIVVSTRDNSATVAVTQARITTTISVSPSTINYFYNGGTREITVTSNAPWTASTNDNWITLSGNTGTGNGTVTVICNSTESDRFSTITFTTLDATASTTINQYYDSPYLYFDRNELSFNGNGGTSNLNVHSNLDWEISTYDNINGLIIKSLGSGTISFNRVDSSSYFKCHYSLNFGEEQIGNSIAMSAGDTLIITDIRITASTNYGIRANIVSDFNYYVEGDLSDSTYSNCDIRYFFRNSTGLTNASGLSITSSSKLEYMFSGCTNLETLPQLSLSSTGNSKYYQMFKGCSSLKTITLPNITLGKYSCEEMFANCTGLTSVTLTNTTMEESCYYEMFSGCTSLKNVVLPASTLAPYCYCYMFKNCTSLTSAPELPATTLADSCYSSMFIGCTSLTTAPALPATVLSDNCYARMFEGCTNLTQAPELPATTLANFCYNSMFANCTSLTSAPELPATTLASNCYYGMFVGCNSLTSAPELPATTLADSCYYNMFKNCSNLTIAPELPAVTLASACYWYMFQGCTNLSYIKCLAVVNDFYALNYPTSYWVDGVQTNAGLFIKNSEMNNWGNSGRSSIPNNWTVQDA